MYTENIIDSVHKLIRFHEQLKAITQSKMTIVKEGKIEELSSVLAKEQLLIQQVEKEESKRANYVEKWFLARDLEEKEVDRTMTNMLEHLTGEPYERLEQATTTLLQLITDIKQQEHINHGLIQQSLQFVHMSLHMLQPSLEQMNYGKNREQLQQHGKRSMFDSKA